MCTFRFEGKFEELDSSEVPTDNGHLLPHSTALNCASGIGHHEANLAMLPEVGHCMSDLGPPLSQDSASQCNDPNSPHHDFVGGIMRITPAEVNTDADYWLLSDSGVGITDMWRSDPSNALWDDVVRLNAEFGIDTLGSPRPHTPPSSSALEVDPVS